MTDTDHDWPADANEHVWGPWMSQSRTTQYRTCVHPLCHEVDEREVPNG